MVPQVLQRCLNARQFALKLIANVSYGYTSASFSGRMPCAELADAIVQVGRAVAVIWGLPSGSICLDWGAASRSVCHITQECVVLTEAVHSG
jgi:hypothetical protein